MYQMHKSNRVETPSMMQDLADIWIDTVHVFRDARAQMQGAWRAVQSKRLQLWILGRYAVFLSLLDDGPISPRLVII